jgi:ACT domain
MSSSLPPANEKHSAVRPVRASFGNGRPAAGANWTAAVVQAPRSRAPGDAHLVRLRLRDRPGALAAITERFAEHGVDVLGLEVLGREAGWAIDDFQVSGPGLFAALDGLGPEVSVLAFRRGVDLLDPALSMAAACEAVTTAGHERETYARLLASALGLVFAEAGFVCIREGYGFLRPVAATVTDLPALDETEASLVCSALFSGECLAADGRVPWAPQSYRSVLPTGAVAAIPGGTAGYLVLALIREDVTPFVSAELQRLAALVRVAVGTLALHDSFSVSRRATAVSSPGSAF